MQGYGGILKSNAMSFSRVFNGDLEQVWNYIVDPVKRGEWLASGTSALRVGEHFTLEFDNRRLTPHDEVTPEKYKEIENGMAYEAALIDIVAPTLFKFSWPSRDDEEGIVTIHLEAKPEGVVLTLIHEGIKDVEVRIGALAGWHAHLDILVEKFHGRVPNPFWTFQQSLETYYRERYSKLSGNINQES